MKKACSIWALCLLFVSSSCWAARNGLISVNMNVIPYANIVVPDNSISFRLFRSGSSWAVSQGNQSATVVVQGNNNIWISVVSAGFGGDKNIDHPLNHIVRYKLSYSELPENVHENLAPGGTGYLYIDYQRHLTFGSQFEWSLNPDVIVTNANDDTNWLKVAGQATYSDTITLTVEAVGETHTVQRPNDVKIDL